MSAQTFSLTDLSALGFGTSQFDRSALPPPTAPPTVAPPVSGISAFENAISGLSSLAAPWFTAISGQSVIPIASTPQQAALQQVQIQQQAQAKLLQTAPNTAGLLANPTVLLIAAGLFVLLLYAMSQRRK
jgi:hypothetical protein